MEYKHSDLIKCPLASVFIFTYNQEKLVGKTIDSILRQKTNFPFEVIIAEDCSTDNTKEVCLDFFKRHTDKIVLIANDSNKGLIKNYFETILEYTRGKYIAQCAGDDWWIDDDKLQKQVDFLEQNKGYDLIYAKSKIYDQRFFKFRSKPMGVKRVNFEKMLVANGIPALTACFTKAALIEYVNEINPLVRAFAGEDYPMWIWFAFRKKIYFCDHVTTAYRLQYTSISNSIKPERLFVIEQDRRYMRTFFYNYFGIKDKKLWLMIEIKYFIETMRLGPMIRDVANINERNAFFRREKLFLLYFFSKLYALCGKNKQLNNVIYILEKIVKKIGITRKYYY
jgi:glycosyltransferase involved in cell wall biosynthesis